MTTPPIETVALRPAGWEGLVAGDGSALASDEVGALEVAGLLVAGNPAGMLADGLAVVADPLAALDLQRGERRGHGWVGGQLSVLLTPGGEEQVTVTLVPTLFLCETLARMNEVGPRPRVDRPVRLRMAASALAEALATLSPELAAAGVEGEVRAEELARELVSTLRSHWRVECHWAPAPSSPGVRVIEVIDTAAGVWLVVPDASHVELWPATPTAVWRLLAGLLPRDHELESG